MLRDQVRDVLMARMESSSGRRLREKPVSFKKASWKPVCMQKSDEIFNQTPSAPRNSFLNAEFMTNNILTVVIYIYIYLKFLLSSTLFQLPLPSSETTWAPLMPTSLPIHRSSTQYPLLDNQGSFPPPVTLNRTPASPLPPSSRSMCRHQEAISNLEPQHKCPHTCLLHQGHIHLCK